MKWKNTKDARKFIQKGRTRHIKKFAYLPVKLDDGHSIWLESYWHTQRWDDGTTTENSIGGFWNKGKTSTKHPGRPDTGTPTWRS
jgi:hypothetical protein